MKCIACGREMRDRGSHYECSNLQCDYEEDIETREVWARLKQELQGILVNNHTKSLSLNC
jgi:hypothetical protein